MVFQLCASGQPPPLTGFQAQVVTLKAQEKILLMLHENTPTVDEATHRESP